jgi:sulfatase maturation enzyme AslB (radical SAM superfamily)
VTVRDSIKNHKRSPNCAACWQLEDAGLTSERQIHNRTMDFLLDLNIDNIEAVSIANGFDPVNIKLATSNLCNGQCVTCNSTLSSSWAQLEGASTQYRSLAFDQLDANINWKTIKSLSFVGGEPLLEKKNIRILEVLSALGNTDCFISFVTNGSVKLTEFQISMLKKFKNLNICLSIDGVGSVFEYMRYPLKWDDMLASVDTFKEITNNVSVSCMISNLNIYYYNEIVSFFKANKLNYLCKQIEDPAIFHPSNLPQEAKERVLKNNPNHQDEVAGFLNMQTFDPALFTQFQQEVVRQDQLKNINMVDYMYLL